MSGQKDLQVREEIQNAAMRLYQKWGVNKTTMEDIARESGRGKSTLYYYFKNKDEIFEICLTTEMDAIVGRAQDSINDSDPSRKRLSKYVATRLIEIQKTASVYPLISGELRANKEFIDRMLKKLVDREMVLFRRILVDGINRGEYKFLTMAKIDKAASALVSMVHGLTLQLFTEDDDAEKIEIISQLITEGL
jgi:AcrR family transcriptional regulator